MKDKVIAIDGVSYVGKSTIAQALAKITGFSYINTGHMYRAVAKTALELKLSEKEESELEKSARNLRFEFLVIDGESKTIVNGADWTKSLDRYEIVELASKIATIGSIRNILTEQQRELSQKHLIIMEGRDIGSVVFPHAMFKFFITASVEIRARRMFKMMSAEEQSQCKDPLLLVSKVEEIDERDRNRKLSPLLRAPDALLYDNSDSPSEVQDALILNYYLTHEREIAENAKILSSKLRKKGIFSGKH